MQSDNTMFRLSRIRAPRSSMLSVVLLIIVFSMFGIWASAQPSISPPDGKTLIASLLKQTNLVIPEIPAPGTRDLKRFILGSCPVTGGKDE